MNNINAMNTMNTIKPTPEMRKLLKHFTIVVDEERPVVDAILSNKPFTINQVEILYDYYLNGLKLNLDYKPLSELELELYPNEIRLYWLIKNSPGYRKYELSKLLTN